MTLAKSIKAARLAADLTQEQAAARAGIRQGAWSEIESGHNPNPTWATIEKIAAGLKVPIGRLVGGKQ